MDWNLGAPAAVRRYFEDGYIPDEKYRNFKKTTLTKGSRREACDSADILTSAQMTSPCVPRLP